MPTDLIHEVHSTASLDEIERRIHAAAVRRQFGVIGSHDLRKTMEKKGVQLDMECRIYEICNPHDAKRVLDADGAASTVLPCRISVYGNAGAYRLATLRPTQIMTGLGVPGMDATAAAVESAILAIMEEAAVGEDLVKA